MRPPMETDVTRQAHLVDYARPLLARKWMILVAVTLATGGVFAYYSQKPDVFRSSTLVFVKDPGDPVSGTPSPQSTDRSVSNQAAMLYARSVARTIAPKVGFDGTAAELLRRVSLRSRAGEDFVSVSARGDTPEQAADIANAYAAEFVALVNTSQSSRVDRALAISREQLRRVPRGPDTLETRQLLGAQIRRLDLAKKVPPSTARQVDPALPPAARAEPKPMRNALFAFVISLVLAVAAAFGLERFDRRLKRPEEVEEAYGVPVLTVVPHTNEKRAGAVTLGRTFREPFRILRTNIELARVDDPVRTLVVTSAVPGEGKSTVAHSIALAYGEAGKSVAVVDADLRRPTLPKLFGAAPGFGLTDVIRGERTLDQAMQRVGADARDLPSMFDDARSLSGPDGERQEHGIKLLLGGRTPANPPAVLASARLVEVLDELRERFDIVIIDSAPLLAVTDTVPLLRYADATVVVGRMGVTTRDTAKRVVTFLARVPGADLLGVVANDLPWLEGQGFRYGYDYGGGAGVPAAELPVSANGAHAEPPKLNV